MTEKTIPPRPPRLRPGSTERHWLEPCPECSIWHCPVCGCPARYREAS